MVIFIAFRSNLNFYSDKFQSEFTLKPTETGQFIADTKKDGYWEVLNQVGSRLSL